MEQTMLNAWLQQKRQSLQPLHMNLLRMLQVIQQQMKQHLTQQVLVVINTDVPSKSSNIIAMAAHKKLKMISKWLTNAWRWFR